MASLIFVTNLHFCCIFAILPGSLSNSFCFHTQYIYFILFWLRKTVHGVDCTKRFANQHIVDSILYHAGHEICKFYNVVFLCIAITLQNNVSYENSKSHFCCSSCGLDMFNFPYDTQICHLEFGNFIESEMTVNVSIDQKIGLATDLYSPSNEFNLTSTEVHRTTWQVRWNASSCKTRTYLFYMANNMHDDIMATQLGYSSGEFQALQLIVPEIESVKTTSV